MCSGSACEGGESLFSLASPMEPEYNDNMPAEILWAIEEIKILSCDFAERRGSRGR